MITDAPTDNHGKGESFSPTDLVASALISCMITVMAIAAERKNISFNGVSGLVQKKMKNNPRRIDALIVKIRILEEGQTTQDKESLKKIANDCPVALSLHPDVNQVLSIEYH